MILESSLAKKLPLVTKLGPPKDKNVRLRSPNLENAIEILLYRRFLKLVLRDVVSTPDSKKKRNKL